MLRGLYEPWQLVLGAWAHLMREAISMQSAARRRTQPQSAAIGRTRRQLRGTHTWCRGVTR